MASAHETPARRDLNVRLTRGLRTGLVTAAVASSLGLFGYVAADSATHATAPTSAATPQASPAATSHRVAIAPGTASAPHAVTSGSTVVTQPGTTTSSGSTSVRPGSGTVHAVSHGS